MGECVQQDQPGTEVAFLVAAWCVQAAPFQQSQLLSLLDGDE